MLEEVGMSVEDMLQADMDGEGKQWAVVGEGKEMVDTWRNLSAEVDRNEMEFVGKQLAGKGLLKVVGLCMEEHGMQMVLHKEVLLAHVLGSISAIPTKNCKNFFFPRFSYKIINSKPICLKLDVLRCILILM